jgi:hypothetical protein
MALLLRQVCAAALWRLAPRQAHGEHRTLAGSQVTVTSPPIMRASFNGPDPFT